MITADSGSGGPSSSSIVGTRPLGFFS